MDLRINITNDGVMTVRNGRRVVAVVESEDRTREEMVDRVYWELITAGSTLSRDTVGMLIDDANMKMVRR